MAIPKMTDDLNIIQALSDLPNSEDGLTAAQLKAKFDAAGLAIQNYLNNTLIPALIANKIPFASTTAIAAETVQAAIENVQAQVKDAATGTIVNGSITKEKLSEELLARVYGGLAWVSADTPDRADTPSAGFPIGQMWLRPAFTMTNEAGSSWSGSGCTAAVSDGNVVLTGSAQVATVTATQSLTGLGNQGDRVMVLFTAKDKDSEMTSMSIALNAEDAVTFGTGNLTFAGTLSTNGALTVKITCVWPSASLADGSLTLGNYTVVNVDKIMRQITGAAEIPFWGNYVWEKIPFQSYQSPAAVFIQETAGVWTQTGFDVLPVSRGGTGLSSMPANKYMKTDANGDLGFLTKAEVIEDIEGLRIKTGSYTGTGAAGTVTLPVTPKLLVIWPENGPVDNTLIYKMVRDNPIVLGNGAEAGECWGDDSNYMSRVALSGAVLTFSCSSNRAPSFGNRSGVTYNWVAIY